MCSTRPATRGDKASLEKFLPLLEKCIGHSLTLLDIVQKIWAPLGKLFVPSGVPSWLRACAPHDRNLNPHTKNSNFHASLIRSPLEVRLTHYSEKSYTSYILVTSPTYISWKRHPRVRTFTQEWQLSSTAVRLSPANQNFHSPHCKLSPNAMKTLTQYGGNCHSSYNTLVKTPTYSSGKRCLKEREISPTTDNFRLPQWDSHPWIRNVIPHIENSHPIRWELSPDAVITLTWCGDNSHPPK